MKAKYWGMGLIALLLVMVGWMIAHPPQAHRLEAAQGEKTKPGRYQVVGAGLITAVLVDNETGKTWALTPGSMMDGPGRFGGTDQEFAWTPITKFDDLESYRRWVKQQQENRFKWERERWKEKDRDFGKDREKKSADKADDRKDGFKDKGKEKKDK